MPRDLENGSTVLVAPLREEMTAFQRHVADAREIPHDGPGRFFAGHLIHEKVILGWTGDGREAAREGLEALLSHHGVARVVVLGVAGGLTDGLGFGHLVVAREVRDAEGLAAPPDDEWIDRTMKLPGVREAIFYSSDRIVVTAHEKDALGRRLLDESDTRVGAAVADLETATYAKAAASHGVPYTGIRAISDAVNENLPLDFNRFSEPDGRVRRGRVVLHALRRPGLFLRLLALRNRVRFCGRRLNDAAIFVLLSGQSSGPSRPLIGLVG